MATGWSHWRFLAFGLPILFTGLAVLAWESVQESDIEILSAPLLLLGAFLVFEAYLTWRRNGLAGNNAK